MSEEQNIAKAHLLVEEIFNKGNVSLINELIAPDFIEHEQVPGVEPGRAGMAAALNMFQTGFPDFHVTIEDSIASGDKVALRLSWSGTQEGEFMGLPPSGKQFNVAVIDILRFADGKIVEHWGQMDTMGMMQQLGAVPGPQ